MRPYSLFRPLGILLLIQAILSLASLAQGQPCLPLGTLSISVENGADTTMLTWKVDTAGTAVFDAGLDVLCGSDTTVALACLQEGDSLLQTQFTPPLGEDTLRFQLAFPPFGDSLNLAIQFEQAPWLEVGVSWFQGDSLVSHIWNSAEGGVVSLDASVLDIEGHVVPDCSVPGCTNEDACNYNPDATEDDGSCQLPFFCFDCDMNCLCDEDEDGVCDPFEFPGCTDPEACNWAPVYTEEDGSCFYAQPGFDCAGFCLPVENDECGMATPIGCGQVVTATTVCADTANVEFCDQFNIGEYEHGGLWYTIMGTGDTLRATLCFEDTEYDTYLNVFEGGCDDLDCVAGNDDQDEANFFAEPCYDYFLASAVEWDSEEGVEYFLHVNGSNAVTPAVGGFDFVLVCDGVEVGGCLDPGACNYNPFGTFDDGSCEYLTCAGCGLLSACNYDSTAVINDLTFCDFTCYGCTDAGACNYSPAATIESGLCEYSSCAGCLEPEACNYDPVATLDAGNCEYTSCLGCTDGSASNFNPQATVEDGSCTYCDLVLSLGALVMESCPAAQDASASFAVDSALTDSVSYTLFGPVDTLAGAGEEGGFIGLAPGGYLLEVLDGDSSCSAVQSFEVLAAPDLNFFAVAAAPACAGGMDGSVAAFVADTVVPVGFSLNGIAADSSGTFLGLSAGAYFVEVTVLMPGGATCSDTATAIVVDPEGMIVTLDGVEGASPGEENGGAAVTVTGGLEPYEFEWSGPSGITSAEDPDDLASGEWTLTVTGDDGCSTTLVVSVPVGMENLTLDGFAVVPNPAKDRITLRFGAPFSGVVRVLDALGRWAGEYRVDGAETQLSLGHLPRGMYMVRAKADNGRTGAFRMLLED